MFAVFDNNDEPNETRVLKTIHEHQKTPFESRERKKFACVRYWIRSRHTMAHVHFSTSAYVICFLYFTFALPLNANRMEFKYSVLFMSVDSFRSTHSTRFPQTKQQPKHTYAEPIRDRISGIGLKMLPTTDGRLTLCANYPWNVPMWFHPIGQSPAHQLRFAAPFLRRLHNFKMETVLSGNLYGYTDDDECRW